MTVRAKFHVNSITQHDGGFIEIKASPVMSGSEENKAFWAATPSGQLVLGIKSTMPAAQSFEVGRDYYLDFTPA